MREVENTNSPLVNPPYGQTGAAAPPGSSGTPSQGQSRGNPLIDYGDDGTFRRYIAWLKAQDARIWSQQKKMRDNYLRWWNATQQEARIRNQHEQMRKDLQRLSGTLQEAQHLRFVRQQHQQLQPWLEQQYQRHQQELQKWRQKVAQAQQRQRQQQQQRQRQQQQQQQQSQQQQQQQQQQPLPQQQEQQQVPQQVQQNSALSEAILQLVRGQPLERDSYGDRAGWWYNLWNRPNAMNGWGAGQIGF